MPARGEPLDDTHPGRFGRTILLRLTLLVLAAIALVVAFALVSAGRQDRQALASSTRLAETALATKER